MKNLNSLFSSEIEKSSDFGYQTDITSEKTEAAQHKSLNNTVEVSSTRNKPILQMYSVPLLIDLNEYLDPLSAENPKGDYLSAYRFRELTNNIPSLTTYFDPSSYLVESVWDNIIHGANSTFDYTNRIISNAQKKFADYSIPTMSSVPDEWRPVYASPSNWFDILKSSVALSDLTLDFSDSGEISSDAFQTIGKDKTFTWQSVSKDNSLTNDKKQSLDIKSEVKSITLKVLNVNLLRPWLDFELFSLDSWKIDGIQKGYFSEGDISNNDGIFPLFPSSIIFGTDVAISVDWENDDLKLIDEQIKLGNEINIGPFILNSKSSPLSTNKDGSISSNVFQVIGFTSNLVPLAPKI